MRKIDLLTDLLEAAKDDGWAAGPTGKRIPVSVAKEAPTPRRDRIAALKAKRASKPVVRDTKDVQSGRAAMTDAVLHAKSVLKKKIPASDHADFESWLNKDHHENDHLRNHEHIADMGAKDANHERFGNIAPGSKQKRATEWHMKREWHKHRDALAHATIMAKNQEREAEAQKKHEAEAKERAKFPTHEPVHPHVSGNDALGHVINNVNAYHRGQDYQAGYIQDHIHGVENSKPGSKEHEHHLKQLSKHTQHLVDTEEKHVPEMENHVSTAHDMNHRRDLDQNYVFRGVKKISQRPGIDDEAGKSGRVADEESKDYHALYKGVSNRRKIIARATNTLIKHKKLDSSDALSLARSHDVHMHPEVKEVLKNMGVKGRHLRKKGFVSGVRSMIRRTWDGNESVHTDTILKLRKLMQERTAGTGNDNKRPTRGTHPTHVVPVGAAPRRGVKATGAVRTKQPK